MEHLEEVQADKENESSKYNILTISVNSDRDKIKSLMEQGNYDFTVLQYFTDTSKNPDGNKEYGLDDLTARVTFPTKLLVENNQVLDVITH